MTRGLRWLRERILFTDEMEVALMNAIAPWARSPRVLGWAGRDRVRFITVMIPSLQ